MLFRKMFFTDLGSTAKLEQCNMDGTNRTRIVESRIEKPTAVTLDLVRKLVYWADAALDNIEVVDYNGNNRHTVIHESSVSTACDSCYPMIFPFPMFNNSLFQRDHIIFYQRAYQLVSL